MLLSCGKTGKENYHKLRKWSDCDLPKVSDGFTESQALGVQQPLMH